VGFKVLGKLNVKNKNKREKGVLCRGSGVVC